MSSCYCTVFLGRSKYLRLAIFLLATVVYFPLYGIASTFRLPLSISRNPGTDGDYLSADFNFGTAFSHIDKVLLEFVMPNGYESSAVTTGNSSSIRTLQVVIHDLEETINRDSPFLWPPTVPVEPERAWPPNYFIQQLGDIGSQLPTNLEFVGWRPNSICSPAEYCPELPEPEFPNFLFSGRDRIAFIDTVHNSYHPLPSGDGGWSSMNLGSPGVINSAFIRISGIPVPEPSSLVLFLIGLLFSARFGGRTQ